MQNGRILSFAAFNKYLREAMPPLCTGQSSVAAISNFSTAFLRVLGGILLAAGVIFTGSAYATATNCPIAAQGIYNVCTFATAGAGTGASPWTGWEGRLNELPANIEIYFTTGTYQQNTTLVAKKGWTLRGAGMGATTIIAGSTFTGDMIQWGSALTINSSVAAYLTIKDMGLHSPSANARSAAINIVGGTYVNIKNVLTAGFGIGLVLNQAEIVDVEDCDFEGSSSASVAGIYLVNGNYNPSNSNINTSAAKTGSTNRISIQKNQFNGGNSNFIGVYDEGGYVHSIRDNNFNAGARAVYLAGVHQGLIEGNEIEGTQADPIYIDQIMPNEQWSINTYETQSHDLSIRHNSMAMMGVNKSSVLFATPSSGYSDPFVWVASVTDNALGSVNSSSVPSLSGVSHVAGLVAYSNFNGYGGTPISDVGSVTSEIHGTISISTSHAINDPTNPPKGTFYLYVDTDNVLKAKGANGTVTTLAIP